MNIPIVRLNHLVENFPTTGLFGNNGRCSALHGFQRGNPERFGNRRHHKDVTVLVSFIYLPSTLKPGKMETVGNSTLGGQINHSVQHITRTCHNEADITCTFQNKRCCLDKIFRSFLHGDTSQESHDLFLFMLRTRNVQKFLRQRINRIMHGKTFPRILMILPDNRLPCQFRYTHNTIRIIHTVLFRCVYGRVNLSA